MKEKDYELLLMYVSFVGFFIIGLLVGIQNANFVKQYSISIALTLFPLMGLAYYLSTKLFRKTVEDSALEEKEK